MSEDQSGKTAQASKIVRNHSIGTLAAGILPIPLLDAGILVGVHLRMIKKLAELYEVEFSEQRANAIIGSLVGLSTAVAAGSVLTALVPTMRALLGVGAITFQIASTYALGRVFIKHFESGGTFLTFDEERAKKDYDDELAKHEAEHSYAGIKP